MKKGWNPIPAELASSTFRAIGNLFNAVAKLCEGSLRNAAEGIPFEHEIVELLAFREVVTWITKNQPVNDGALKAAVLKENNGSITKITIVYLDEHNQPVVDPNGRPIGRAVRVSELDEELRNYFGPHSMVLFK